MMETLHLLEERLLKQITETGTNPLRPKSCQDDPDSTTDISKPEKKQKKTSSSRKRGAFQDLKQFGEQLENMKRSARKITKRGETGERSTNTIGGMTWECRRCLITDSTCSSLFW